MFRARTLLQLILDAAIAIGAIIVGAYTLWVAATLMGLTPASAGYNG